MRDQQRGQLARAGTPSTRPGTDRDTRTDPSAPSRVELAARAGAKLRPDVGAELGDREAAVVELLVRVARVVEMDAVEIVAPREIGDDALGVGRRLGLQRRRVEALDRLELPRVQRAILPT